MLPLAFAVDASGGEAGGNGGYGVVVTGKDEDEVREELRWAERRGSYQRLSPGKIEGSRWRDTLVAVGLAETGEGEDPANKELEARRGCTVCGERKSLRALVLHHDVAEMEGELKEL